MPDVCKQMAMKPITKYLNANLLYDDATEEARDKAENDVTPVVYKKGQVIVKIGRGGHGGPVCRAANPWAWWRAAFNAPLYIGALLVVLLLTAMGVHLIREQDPDIESKTLLMGGICIVFVLLAALLVIRTNPGFVPVCFVAMTMSMVVNAHTGMVLGNLTSALVGVMALVAGATSQVAFAVLLSGMAGSTACAKLATAAKAARAYPGLRLVAAARRAARCYTSAWALFDGQRIFDAFCSPCWYPRAVASGGLRWYAWAPPPFGSKGFKILTPMKLMELPQPHQPPLHRLSDGGRPWHLSSFHHGRPHLAGGGCRGQWGVNPLLARAAAYYHDVREAESPRLCAGNQPQDGKILMIS